MAFLQSASNAGGVANMGRTPQGIALWSSQLPSSALCHFHPFVHTVIPRCPLSFPLRFLFTRCFVFGSRCWRRSGTIISALRSFWCCRRLHFPCTGMMKRSCMRRLRRCPIGKRLNLQILIILNQCGNTRSSKPTLRDTVLNLFDSIKHTPNDANYHSPSGRTYTAENTTTWTKPLGRKVLIVDIDTV
jgi:hypothetical protein